MIALVSIARNTGVALGKYVIGPAATASSVGLGLIIGMDYIGPRVIKRLEDRERRNKSRNRKR